MISHPSPFLYQTSLISLDVSSYASAFIIFSRIDPSNSTVHPRQVDSMSKLQKENDYTDEHFEYIQWYLRSCLLPYGAGLLYTSPLHNSNTKLLLDYLTHVMYGQKFGGEAQVIDRDAVFVPIGWDSATKMELLKEGGFFV